MANCDFKGLKNVRGTLSKRTVRINGKLVTQRVVAMVTPSGKQKIFIREETPRKKTPTKNELLTRQRFCEAQQKAAVALHDTRLTAQWKKCWLDSGKKLPNGKKYNTLRGFIMAALYQGIKDSEQVKIPI